MSFPDVVSLGRQFDQVSVIYKSLEGVIGMYYLRGGYAEAAVTPSGGMAAQIAAKPRGSELHARMLPQTNRQQLHLAEFVPSTAHQVPVRVPAPLVAGLQGPEA